MSDISQAWGLIIDEAMGRSRAVICGCISQAVTHFSITDGTSKTTGARGYYFCWLTRVIIGHMICGIDEWYWSGCHNWYAKAIE